jgi:hypothetical protein
VREGWREGEKEGGREREGLMTGRPDSRGERTLRTFIWRLARKQLPGEMKAHVPPERNGAVGKLIWTSRRLRIAHTFVPEKHALTRPRRPVLPDLILSVRLAAPD